MKMFRVMYRVAGRIDYCFCIGEDEMAARVEMQGRFPKATFVKASLAKKEVYTNNVIYVDFATKQRKAG